MIDAVTEFLGHWDLFGDSFLVGCWIGIALAQLGVLVVARDQIFVGAAVSQASTLGVALSLGLVLSGTVAPSTPAPPVALDGAVPAAGVGFLDIDPNASDPFAVRPAEPGASEQHPGRHHVAIDDDPWTSAALAIGFAVLAALLTARGSGRAGRESHEAIAGWVFLACASFSILVVVRSDHGAEEVHRLLFSSLLGATRSEAVALGCFAALGVVLVAALRRRLLLVVLDPAMAEAIGLRSRWWETGIAIWLGLSVGFSVRVAGLLYAFGCLVLPALVARSVHREVAPMLITAPLVALAAIAPGFVLSHHFDWPAAQATVAAMSVLVVLGWTFAAARRRLAR